MVLSARFVLSLLALLLLVAPASGSTLVLSQFSSDQTPASVLDATLVFEISGAGELTLSVTNDTAAPDAYLLDQVFFNASSNVAGLTLLSATSSVDGLVTADWRLATSKHAGGFGTFDFALLPAMGSSDNEIDPGETVRFVFAITGTGPFAMADFTTRLSEIPPGNTPSLAAVKFVSGPGDDSAYGAVVPEPLTLFEFGLGLVGLSWLTRRQRRRR